MAMPATNTVFIAGSRKIARSGKIEDRGTIHFQEFGRLGNVVGFHDLHLRNFI